MAPAGMGWTIDPTMVETKIAKRFQDCRVTVELSVTSQDGKLSGVITFLVVAPDGATNGSDKQPMKNIRQEADTLRFEVIDPEGHQHSFQLVKAGGDQADLNETGAHEQEPIQMVRTKN